MEPIYWVIAALILIALIREISWHVRLRRAMRQQTKAQLDRSRSVLKGQISEQMAPLLPGFPYHPGDVRYLGGLVDMVIFAGYHEGRVDEVILADVKSGGARLTPLQREVAEAIADGRVRFQVLRVEETGQVEVETPGPSPRAARG